MTNATAARLPQLLLVEPQFLARRTIAAVARDLRLAEVHEATSNEAAERMMAFQRFDAMFIDLDEQGETLALLERLRTGGYARCEVGMPLAVMAGRCSAEQVMRLKQLEVRRVLLKPFKVKGVLDAIATFWPQPATSAVA